MDRIDLAQRRYEAIVPKPFPAPWQLPHQELVAWLRNDVCPVVADYVKRPRFREQAAWPLEQLRVGAESEERRAIEAVDRALVTCAKALARLAGSKSVAETLRELYPPRATIVREEVLITDNESKRIRAEKDFVDTLAVEISQIRGIAGRFWTDLVCLADYFEPRGGWMLKEPAGNGQPGEFIVSINPELLPIGDLVSRTMLRRVEVLFDLIVAFKDKCLAGVARAARRYAAQLKVVQGAWEELESGYRSLQSVMRAVPTTQIRESCVILTQVYAAFDRSPDVRWLNLPEESIRVEGSGLRFRLSHNRGLEVAERIAASLGDLRALYQASRPEHAAIEEAIASGGLVLVGEPREAYWAGERIKADWYRNDGSWKFLWALAEKASRSSPVDEVDLFGDTVVSRSAMSTAFGRLKSQLPPILRKHIVPGEALRSYRMELQDKRAYFF